MFLRIYKDGVNCCWKLTKEQSKKGRGEIENTCDLFWGKFRQSLKIATWRRWNRHSSQVMGPSVAGLALSLRKVPAIFGEQVACFKGLLTSRLLTFPKVGDAGAFDIGQSSWMNPNRLQKKKKGGGRTGKMIPKRRKQKLFQSSLTTPKYKNKTTTKTPICLWLFHLSLSKWLSGSGGLGFGFIPFCAWCK